MSKPLTAKRTLRRGGPQLEPRNHSGATRHRASQRAGISADPLVVGARPGLDDYASPAKRFFLMMAWTPQLPSTTCVMP
jgi:hypothetical protein